jgi:glycosyltransferase involved in cell wall biosynthesis
VSFTVLIPCHNDGDYLPRSVGSAATQLHAGDEIIVVDDGSDAPVSGVVQALNEQFANVSIRCIRQPQSGVSAARNAGMDAASGDYLIMLDADDELLPGTLDRYRAAIAAQAPAWIIAAHEWQVGDERTVRTPDLKGRPEQLFQRFLDKQLHIGNLSCMCIRRDLARSIRFAEHLRVGEDRVLLCVLLALHPPLLETTPCARVHRRPSGSLRSVSSIEDAEQSQVYDTLFEHPLLPEAFRVFRTRAEIRHCRSVLRMAWRQKRADVYARWYAKLWRLAPLAALHPKLAARRLVLAARA